MSDDAFVSPPLKIDAAFLDHNGHVNMAYHLVLADRALDLAFTEIKGRDYVDGRGMTTFAAEVHVRYLREMNVEDEIRGRVSWVASDGRKARWAVELLRSQDKTVVTTVEGVSLSVAVETRRVADYPFDVAERLSAAVARDADRTAAADWLGRHVAMSRD